MMAQLLDNGLIQLGFAGFSLILLGMIIWTIKQLINSNLRSDRVMAKLTDAIKTLELSLLNQMSGVSDAQDRLTNEVRHLTETVNRNPCIMENRGN